MELQETITKQLEWLLLSRYGITDLVSQEELKEVWSWVTDYTDQERFLDVMAGICARLHYRLPSSASDDDLRQAISVAVRKRYNLSSFASSKELFDAVVHASNCKNVGLPPNATVQELEVARLEQCYKIFPSITRKTRK